MQSTWADIKGGMEGNTFAFQKNLGNRIDSYARETYKETFADAQKGLSAKQRQDFLRNNPSHSHLAPGGGGFLAFSNRINNYLKDQGRGFNGGFTSVGQVVGAAPLKHLAKGYGTGLGMMAAMEFGLMGKDISLRNIGSMAFDNVAFTLGSELAGTGFKGIAKYMGWQMVGEQLGLGTWGSLGLQVAGAAFMPGLGMGLAAGIGGYKAGKALFSLGQTIHDIGKRSRETQFTSGDMSWMTGEANTMRQRSLSAIQNSHLNMRSILGNEAQMLSMVR